MEQLTSRKSAYIRHVRLLASDGAELMRQCYVHAGMVAEPEDVPAE